MAGKCQYRSILRLLCPLLLLLMLVPGWVVQDLALPPQFHFIDSKKAAKMVVHEVKPRYPVLAKVNYIQGAVRLEIRVTKDGQVVSTHVIKGHPFLAMAAIEAIQTWKYSPPDQREMGPFETFVDVKFTLHVRDPQQLPPTAEADLRLRVHPPELVSAPAAPPGPESVRHTVRLRVLVNDAGQAIDSDLVSGPAGLVEAAKKEITNWTFKPARWGNHAVPWYLTVDVHLPAEGSPTLSAVESSSQ